MRMPTVSVPGARRGALAAAAALLLAAGAAGGAGPLTVLPAEAAVQGDVFVSPQGSDSNPGTRANPVQTPQRAQQLVRQLLPGATGDVTVVLEDGLYRMTSPLTLTAADSGSNGHNVIWTADTGARPVLAGSVPITSWTPIPSFVGVWMAQGPPGIRTRQLYVNGARAQRATGPLPVTLTQTATGYTASAATMAAWRDPSGQAPPEIEFVYPAGLGAWTEPRCPVASMSGTTITMAQPCWNNSTRRGSNHVGPGNFSGPPARVENALQLLTQPGRWYLDTGSSRFFYKSRPGENMATARVEAPVLQSLVTGAGTAASPIHNIVFNGIQFSYATWLGASSPTGFSEVQANYLNQGSSPTAGNAGFNWTQIPANVSLTYSHSVQFTNDAFVHLGGAGLGLGDGSQNDVVLGNVVTDTSGNGIELGNDDMATATGANQTVGNTIRDNYVFATPVEFHGGIGIDVGYAASTLITHNQVDRTPYSGMSIGWGGWPDKVKRPGLTNFSHDNTISDNLVFDHMQVLNDGAAIYTNGQTSASRSFATGEHLTGNVVHDQMGRGHEIYTDNGTDWITITGNAMYNPGATANAWGRCHNDYYPGEGGGLDNFMVTGNYWEKGAGNSTGHCTVQGNHVITSPGQIPASIVSSAGLEPAFQGLLNWTPAG